MKSYEVRKTFLDHFEKYDHLLVKSSSLIPADDPTLLFNNAGMNQFKGIFTGEQPPPRSKRATSSQKCVRAGGKHNDLDNVGFTARHHTFFEMLGNFSFGDYFKVGAIEMAWELLTKKFNLDPKRLYITVYEDDDEAADIWKKHIFIPSDKIYRFGQKDNFWRMGDTGPCGPCSEIFYDLGESVGGDPKQNVMGGDGDRFIEIWNLVFMQFFEDEKGLIPLPKPSIDTGMGLERISSILQGQINNYNSDLFLPLINVASTLSKTNYSLDMATDNKEAAALRVIADHSRAVSFLLADGVIPSNEGRGYVLRRILRRAVRYARTLTDASVFPEVCKEVIITMNDVYPELNQSKDFILKTVKDEQDRFLETLDKGTELLNDEISRIKKTNTAKGIIGDFVFKLYDTFGFPSDLTRLMAEEQGLTIDEEGFQTKLNEAKEKSKSVKNSKSFIVNNADMLNLAEAVKAERAIRSQEGFVGYTDLFTHDSVVDGILNQTDPKNSSVLKQGHSGLVVFNKTPFYAEGGGQAADIGTGTTNNGSVEFEITDVQKANGIHIHVVTVTKGELGQGQVVKLYVDENNRNLTASNHSATHLLHFALRKELGTHVKQAGSLVNAEKLRFDFTNKGPLTDIQIQNIENRINGMIQKSIQVQQEIKSYTKAVEDGALALFGEKYEDEVRVISMGDSIELCGGTHVSNISQIKYFKIISESGVSSGVRRIEAITDYTAINYLNSQFEDFKAVKNMLQLPMNTDREAVLQQLQKFKNEISDLKKELKTKATDSFSIEEALKSKVTLGEFSFVVCTTDISDNALLRDTADRLRDKIQNGVIVILGSPSKKTPLLVSVTKALSQKVPAGPLLKQLTAHFGGSGGGRPDMAQGAVMNVDNFALDAKAIVQKYMESLV